ncbi:hypothetical protein TWF718_003775 [Orbilia javanica]|uniref:Uncharacterized protein n=1 Tax=Orbilia javanica TaxID=47235 RepID=A0AAN8NYT4_9PEZI
MMVLSVKSLVATGFLVLVPISVKYAFHSPADILNLTTAQVPISTNSEHHIYSSLEKRDLETSKDPPLSRTIEVSKRCSPIQSNKISDGLDEVSALLSGFPKSLQELKYERAVGDYLGHSWKTSGFAQRIIGMLIRFARFVYTLGWHWEMRYELTRKVRHVQAHRRIS